VEVPAPASRAMISSEGVGLARAEEKKRRVGRMEVRKCMVGFLETRLLVWKCRWCDASARVAQCTSHPLLIRISLPYPTI
jgi:hypothetical protein